MKMNDLKKQLAQQKIAPIYLVLGEEDYLIQQAQTLFLNLLAPEERDMNFASYDLSADSLGSALDDATSVPFFGERRLVWLKEPAFLTAQDTKAPTNQELASLTAYLNHPLDTTVLVIFAKVPKLDGRKKISKLVQKQATVVDVQKLAPAAIEATLTQLLQAKDYQLAPDSKELLIQRSDADFSAIVANLEKLFIAAADDKVITRQMVAELVSPTLEDNVFDLVDRVLHRDVQSALALYQDLLLNKEEPIRINSILISQFRLLLQVKILAKKGMTQGNLTQILKVHPYRIKLALKTVKQFSQVDLRQAYLGLQDNDYQMKSGQQDKMLLFELFMLKFAS